MSTRRARIKAVAALPQRRKNVDHTVKKSKEQIRQLVENVIKSPKDGHAAVDKLSTSSPVRGAPSPRKPSPRISPRASLNADPEKVSTDWKMPTPTPIPEKRSSTPLRDKTETNKVSGTQDVFVSPPARASPLTRSSPVVRTPAFEVDVGVEKLTPHKRLLELQGAQKHKVTDNRYFIISSKPVKNTIATNSGMNMKNIVDGYNSPNTPENDVMDGIELLKPISNAPKSIVILKDEIISNKAEVLFDPIVPLSSPTKVRQKLRSVPRLGPMRRNSISGRASESEDESRRSTHGGSSTPVPSRQRHDTHTSDSTMSHPIRNRRWGVSRQMAAARRNMESVQRDKHTMFDLIFHNPTTNPIVPDQDEVKAKEATKKIEEQRRQEDSRKEDADGVESSEESATPVPQMKLGANGEIILDEQSLVIKQSEQRKLSESVVYEGAWMSKPRRVYPRTARTANWSFDETVRFYRALAALGTDFTVIATLFPGRTRRDIVLKFKKEEQTNLAQVEKALLSALEWNPVRMRAKFENERRLAEEHERQLKEQLQEEKKAIKEHLKLLKDRRSKQSAERADTLEKDIGNISSYSGGKDESNETLHIKIGQAVEAVEGRASKLLGMSALPDITYAETADQLIAQSIKDKKTKRRTTTIVEAPRHALSATVNPTDRISPEFATLIPVGSKMKGSKVGIPRKADIGKADIATIQKTAITPPHTYPLVLNALPPVPSDITPGSLVVLTVDDPKAPSQKVIHTYVKQADGNITSIVLDPSVMSSLVSFMKKDTAKAGSTSTMSPNSVVSDRTSTPPVGASPNKRKRLPSYTITDL